MPFSYQAQGISFADWANLFTLCLAPLIAHVFGGSPSITQLSSKPPRWHERLWQYNPTSILWRYFVIADRRLRAKSWSASQMAASNAYFWTALGWDGSLDMMERSRAYSLRLPTHHRVRMFSGSTLISIIITVQGAMAIKTLIGGITGADASYPATVNISSIFYPLAVFSLLRISAAMWLTDDYLYYGDIDSIMPTTSHLSDLKVSNEDISSVDVRAHTTMGLLDSTESLSSEQFHQTNTWRAIIFRIVYLAPICCLLVMCLLYIIPEKLSGSYLTVTTFLMVLFYATFLTASTFLFGFYFLSDRSTSSIIPCCNAMWYKVYTAILMTLTLILVIIACLETRKTPCGVYTTYPRDWASDSSVCLDGIPILANQATEPGVPRVPWFGLAQLVTINSNGTIGQNSTDARTVLVGGFEGMCFGSAVGNSSIGAPVEPLNDTFVPATYWK